MAVDNSAASVIQVPQGGGAQQGLGEKFAPDLHTGTGNFTVPIALPPGRNGFQPDLSLIYSTGQGNGPFGFGWHLSVPGVTRKTSSGIPRYDDDSDLFVLSGAEDLVPLAGDRRHRVYRPRTEGLFARITHHRQGPDDYWQVKSRDGLTSLYGTPGAAGNDSAAVADPSKRNKVFAWQLTRTSDPFSNRIEYSYLRDSVDDGVHFADQVFLAAVRYADVTNGPSGFLISVNFVYEDQPGEIRPDPFSHYRAGFEIRTQKRCKRIEIRTGADGSTLARVYRFIYQDELSGQQSSLPLNRASLLSEIRVEGRDGLRPAQPLPPLELGYSQFQPGSQRFRPVGGGQLPASSLADSNIDLVGLFGNGLLDILETQGAVRYWRNLGYGSFDAPRTLREAPAGLSLSSPGVQILDANGDGRADLLITSGALSGYFPLRFERGWDQHSFQRYDQAPSFDLKDPEVKLLDLDGDGVTDVLRSGTTFECFFNDAKQGFTPGQTRRVERRALTDFPNVQFSDPRVRWGDMTGDGLQDIVFIHQGSVSYWPNLGYGNWGKRVTMRPAPRLPDDYDPARLVLGDVDGDGCADLAYVADGSVTLWINQSGNGFCAPIVIRGTPRVASMQAVRLVDLEGSGVGGLLWSEDAGGESREPMHFLDFTGGKKPYLLERMTNQSGGETLVSYAPSTRFYLQDELRPETRWKTSLPFPVQVVERVEVFDHFSQRKLTTQYRYHEGYWDGTDREFRGFARVDQLDADSAQSSVGAGHPVAPVPPGALSPPTEIRTWFHQGALDAAPAATDTRFEAEFWTGDPPRLHRPKAMNDFLDGLSLPAWRDAQRSLRGSILRTELYAQDGTARESLPYQVSESVYGVREESAPAPGETRRHVFFPHRLAQRTSQWERGQEPLTTYHFTEGHDAYGLVRSQISIAVPRGRDERQKLAAPSTEPYFATHALSDHAQRDDANVYLVDRVSRTTRYEMPNDGNDDLDTLKARIASSSFDSMANCIGETLSYFDGLGFQGLPLGQLGNYGALVRTETLCLTQDILQSAYQSGPTPLTPAEQPPYLAQRPGAISWPAEYPAAFKALFPASLAADPERPEFAVTCAGYGFAAADATHSGGYYVATARSLYDFQAAADGKGRGLVVEQRDAMGSKSSIDYEPFGLLPFRVTNAAGLTTQADPDYRVFKPALITDPNGNRTRFTFTPLGLVESISVLGKPGQNAGDEGTPGTVFSYDFEAFSNSGQPICARTSRRVHHATDTGVPLPERDQTIDTVEYSDGFGRVLQTRRQAEDVLFGNPLFGGNVLPADPNDDAGTRADIVGRSRASTDPQNVVVSGWQTYDNKGRVVEKYEPFYSTGWAYVEPGAEPLAGAKAMLRYDPTGRLVRTVNPDGSEQRVLRGVPADLTNPDQFAPTPWTAFTYDANDNAGRTDPAGSGTYQTHWNTPASATIDALSRAIEAVARNGADAKTDAFITRFHYDVRGNVLSIMDPLGKTDFRQVYDLANRSLRVETVDAGVHRTVLDAAGRPIEFRDSKGALLLRAFDAIGRPTRTWARDAAADTVTLRESIAYGDSADAGIAGDPSAANLKGKVFRQRDEAGVLTYPAYDFKGNALEKVRQVVNDDALLAAFNPAPAGWVVHTLRIDWDSPATPGSIDPVEYRISSAYDALNRLTQMQYPMDVNGTRRVLTPTFNRAGALDRVTLDEQVYIDRIAYDAKGQRTLVAFGNGLMTRIAHDPRTFRMQRLRTEPFTDVSGTPTYRPSAPGAPLQDLTYAYDLIGNILDIFDRTPGCGVLNNSGAALLRPQDPKLASPLISGDALVRHFIYDPIYRLLSATGRECKDIQAPRPWSDDPRCGFGSGKQGTPNQDNAPNLTALYTETYRYDPASNLLSLGHQSASTSWVRRFGMSGLTPDQWDAAWPTHLGTGEWLNPPGNRLTHLGAGSVPVPQTHFFDPNGNLAGETTSRAFEWDESDRLKVFRVQVSGTEPSIHTQFLYDSGGQRVKKLVRKQGGQVEVTVYIDGVFEQHRLMRAGGATEHALLHVLDGRRRIAIVRAGAPFAGDGSPDVQYHFDDHLGSSEVVADATGSWVSREEYLPYGETSFGSFSQKRYRFTGKERDAESGLYYFGARYYAPWLARWGSCDPMGHLDGLNLYSYVSNRPTILIDQTGREGAESQADEGRSGEKFIATSHVAGNDGEHASGAELSIGYGDGEGPKGKVEYQRRLGEEGKIKVNLEHGPWIIKEDSNEHVEYGVRVGPATLSVEDGNPKAALAVDVSLNDVKVEGKVEAKASILANSDPYSAGNVDVVGEVKVKAKGFEAGVKGNIYSGKVFFGPGGSTSEAIMQNRQRLAEASGDTDVKNIKQEVQEDQAAGIEPRTPSVSKSWEIFKNAARWVRDLWNNPENLSNLDQNGRMVDPSTGRPFSQAN